MLYAFRIKQEDNTISHHGVVSANNMTELFWALDEHVDPGCVEVKKLSKLVFALTHHQTQKMREMNHTSI